MNKRPAYSHYFSFLWAEAGDWEEPEKVPAIWEKLAKAKETILKLLFSLSLVKVRKFLLFEKWTLTALQYVKKSA